MGKRSKEYVEREYIAPNDAFRKAIQARRQKRLDAYRNGNYEPSEMQKKSWYSNIGNRFSFERELPDLMDIALSEGVDVNDVIAESGKLYKEERKLSFGSVLTDSQIQALLPVMNDLIFAEAQSLQSVKEWLNCRHKEPQRVKKNGLLGYLLRLLSWEDLIRSNWQTVAEKCKVFVGLQGSILTKKSFSSSIGKMQKRMKKINGDRGIETILNQRIYDAVRGLKG